MGKVAITESILDSLADAIGSKSGESTPMTLAEMIEAVYEIPQPSGTKLITANGTGIDVANYATADVSVPTGTARTSSDITVSGNKITIPDGLYGSQIVLDPAVTSGSATAPASISASGATVTQIAQSGGQLILSKTVSVTPSVTPGYVSEGTAGDTDVELAAQVPVGDVTTLSVNGATVTAASGYYANSASKSVASGTAGTPTATKGAVSNYSVSVTPSVTNTTGYITGSTIDGTPVTVTASELVSGAIDITQNDTYDVSTYASAVVNVAGGGGGSGIYQDNDGYIVLPTEECEGIFWQDQNGYIILPTDKWGTPPELQAKSKTYTPTMSTQSEVVSADSGYDGLSSVTITVNPIPENYGLITWNGSVLTVS